MTQPGTRQQAGRRGRTAGGDGDPACHELLQTARRLNELHADIQHALEPTIGVYDTSTGQTRRVKGAVTTPPESRYTARVIEPAA